jgi:hypothetical protein
MDHEQRVSTARQGGLDDIGRLRLAALVTPVQASQTQVAIAAKFQRMGARAKNGRKAILITSASGTSYTQITHAAPCQVFLSADEERPPHWLWRMALQCRTAAPGMRSETKAPNPTNFWSGFQPRLKS